MRRDIDFFSVYRSSQSDDKARTFNKIAIIILLGSLSVVLAVFGVLKISNFGMKSANRANQNYLASKEVIEARKQIEDVNRKMTALNLYKKSAQEVSDNFKALPQPDSELLTFIASKLPSDTSVDAISYKSTVLTLQCSCDDNLSAAAFVHALAESGRFNSVNYNGVSKTEKSARFTFSVEIALKGGSEK